MRVPDPAAPGLLCVCVCALKVDASEGPCCRHQLEAVGWGGRVSS